MPGAIAKQFHPHPERQAVPQPEGPPPIFLPGSPLAKRAKAWEEAEAKAKTEAEAKAQAQAEAAAKAPEEETGPAFAGRAFPGRGWASASIEAQWAAEADMPRNQRADKVPAAAA